MDHSEEIASQHVDSNFLIHEAPAQSVKDFFEKQMNIDHNTIRKVLETAMSQGGDYADLYFEYTLRNSIILEEGIIKNSSKAVIMGVGIRVLKGEQTGYAYSEDFNLKPMLHAAQTAAAIASSAQIKSLDAVKFNDLVPKNYYPILNSISDLEISKKIKLLQDIESHAHAHDERVMKVTATFADSTKLIMVAESSGKILRDIRPMFRMSVQCVAQEEDNIQVGFSGVGGRVGTDFLKKRDQAHTIAEKAAAQSILLLNAKQAPSGSMPVLLGPAQSGILLHEAVGHPIEADFNRKGSSAYSGRVGEKVASELCTIYDSGIIESDRGAINFDDEGNSPRENVLIENGVLRGYMHDKISADYYKTTPSGNGRRESYAHYPLPRMTTTYLANGETPSEEIIKSVKKGIFCESFSGGQVDIANGDFVFVPTVAYMVEDGKLTYPIKNFTLIGNGPDALSKIEMVGNDFAFSEGIWTCGKDGQSVPVGVGLPTVLISELTVGGM